MILSIFITSICLFVIGALASLVFSKQQKIANNLSNFFAIAGCAVGMVLGSLLLFGHTIYAVTIPTSLPLFALSLRLDNLAGYFIIIISTIGIMTSVYGMSYMRSYFKKYSIGVFGMFYNIFLLSLFLVVVASNAFYFLFVWEIMSVTSLFLVLFEYHHQENVKAGITYFVMTHVGTVSLLLSFLLLYITTHTVDFWSIKTLWITLPLWVQNTVFILTLIGFGTKAGIIPLHIWLPKAHSATPSHVSALMSGVMIKMGIFMFFRLYLDIFSSMQYWWGATILIIGGISALLGVLYALSEHDSKRLLAYHSIENIGIILLGLGSSMIFLTLHMPTLALLAAAAGLFHTLNHAIFKSLLFLGAGSVTNATHTRNIEKYGGLIKVMPYTALVFLIGSIAISGLPPFNGFASEWVTFQSIFAGINSSVLSTRVLFIFAGGSLALTGGLAAACFVKAFGVTFLARPRSEESKSAKESSWWMVVPMGVLALLCFLLGLNAEGVLQVIRQVVMTLGNFANSNVPVSDGITVYAQNNFSQLNMPVVVFSLVAIVAIVYLLTTLISRRRKIIKAVTWDCGYTGLAPDMEITATAFSRSLILIFKGLFQPTSQHQIEYIDAKIRYFAKSRTVNLVTENIYEKYFYDPLASTTTYISKQIKRIQGGNLNQYLLYIFITILGLLLWARYF